MDKVYFKVDGQSLIKTGGLSTYASHTVKYIEAEFALTDEWLSYDSIRAIWQNGDTDIPTAVTHGRTMIPAGVLTKKGRLIVNLVASTVDGDEIDRRLTTYPTTAFMITVEVKIDGADPEIITPSQYEQFVSIVRDEVAEVTGMSAEATTLPSGSDATASYSDGVLSFGIPRGEKGETGEQGQTGSQGPQGVQGPKGDKGDTGPAGADYILTSADKTEIANTVYSMIESAEGSDY